MTVTPIENNGNSSKFKVLTRKGDFVIALSFTLKTRVWRLDDAKVELETAQALAEAIVSRHDPATPFKELYIFAEHNSAPTVVEAVKQIRKHGFSG